MTVFLIVSGDYVLFFSPTDFKRTGDGVQDAHSLSGCGHYNNALWEIDLLMESFL